MRTHRRSLGLLGQYPLLVFAVPAAVCFVVALGLTHGSGTLHKDAIEASWGLGLVLVLGALGAPRAYRSDIARKSGISDIDAMTGEEFEKRLRSLFSSMGYRVQTTRVTGDFGADLVLEWDGSRTVVQAKRYDSTVGLEAIQEVIGAKTHYGAGEALVVTNSHFTEAALTLAVENGVDLVDRAALIEMLAQQAGRVGGSVGPELALRQIGSGIRPAITYSAGVVAAAFLAVAASYYWLFDRELPKQSRLSSLRRMVGDYAVLNRVQGTIGPALRRR